MLDSISAVITKIDGLVWGWWLIILLLGTHIYMTIRLGFIQRKTISKGIKLSVSKDPDAEGEVSQFGALTTALAATIGTLLMALYAKMPFAQACGMGLNSFFFVSFILPQVISGGDAVQGYQAGLVIILISGIIFLVLSLTGARQYIAKAMPECLKKAIPAGIGLFIAFIGFQNVGIIQDNPYTLTQFVDIHGAINGEGGIATVLPALLALLGFVIIGILAKRKVSGAVIIGIIITTVLYYICSGTVPSFDVTQIGQSFKDFAAVGVVGVFKGSSWAHAFSPEFVGGVFSAIMYIITFCLVDMFDTIGTLYGTASQADLLDEKGDPQNLDKCMACDSIATVSGAVLGTSTCTTFVESAAGVAAGGRTGLGKSGTSHRRRTTGASGIPGRR